MDLSWTKYIAPPSIDFKFSKLVEVIDNSEQFSQNNPAFQNGFFISGAELKYQPSDKFEMRFQYRSMPGLNNPNYRRDRFGISGFGSSWQDEW